VDNDPISICSFLLHSGRRCQGPALHRSRFCRHHDPNHPRAARRRPSSVHARPSAPAQPVEDSAPTPGQLRAHWRTYPSYIAQLQADDLPSIIEDILFALSARLICHRSAGRIFAAIADRRLELAEQERLEAWRIINEYAAELAEKRAAAR
jgi:hypothetical protein